MDEYIRREDAMKAIGLSDTMPPSYTTEFSTSLKTRIEAMRKVEEIPAADVAPVVHGTWEEVEYDDGWCEEVGIKCSACGDEWVTLDGEKPQLHNFNYCPNCGAKMDGGTTL